jgi:hypothetical protein
VPQVLEVAQDLQDQWVPLVQVQPALQAWQVPLVQQAQWVQQVRVQQVPLAHKDPQVLQEVAQLMLQSLMKGWHLLQQ